MTKTKKEQFLLYMLVLAGTLAYLTLIFNENVWLDEAFTASLIRTDLKGVLLRSMNDTLPPLYNLLLKIATDLLGYNLQIMKLVSLLPMAGVMLLGARVVYKRFGLKTAALFILSTAAMPNLLYYGVEVRMYSLGFFFVTACGIYAYELLLEPCPKNLILFAVLAAGAGYAHHFAFAAVGFVYLALLLYNIFRNRPGLKHWFISLGITLVLYFPCLIVTLRQMKRVNGYFSMPDITLGVFVKYLRYPYTTGVTALSVLLAASAVLLLLSFILKKDKAPCEWFLLSYFFVYAGVLLLGTAASFVMDANIFVDRYLLPSLGLLWLFCSIEAGRAPRRFYIALAALFLLTGAVTYRSQWKLEYQDGVSEMKKYFDENLEHYDGYVIPYGEYEVMECMTFYYPSLTPYTVKDGRFLQAEIDYTPETESREANPEGLKLWLLTENMDRAFSEESVLPGYHMEYIDQFHFDRYSFSLYNLIRD